MSQNPQETPDQSAGQGSAGSTPGSQTPPTASPWGQADSAAGSGSASPTPSSASSADPYGSAPGSYGSPAQGPYSAPSPYGAPGQGTGAAPGYGQQGYSQPPSDPNYGQSQYPPAGGQQQYGGAPYDPNAAYGPPQQGYPPQQYSQPGYPQYAGQPVAGAPVSESDEKTWGILSHISLPFFWVVGPLIGYLLNKDRSPYLKEVTTEALNFSILFSIVQAAGWVLSFITFGLINLVAFIAALVFCIMATIAASKHEFYKYPVNARMIK
jgi:uncharacterized Tic20 family protein